MSEYIHLNSIFRDRTTYPNPCQYQLLPKQIEKWTNFTRDVKSLPQNANVRPPNFTSSIEISNVTLPYPRIELYATISLPVLVDNISGGNTLNTIAPVSPLAINDIVMTSANFYSGFGIDRNVEYHVVAVGANSFQVSLTQGGPVLPLTNGTGLNMSLVVIKPANYSAVMSALQLGLTLLEMPIIYIDFHGKQYNDQNPVRAIDNNISKVKFIVEFDKFQTNAIGQLNWIHYKANMLQTIRLQLKDTMILTYYDQFEKPLLMFNEPDTNKSTNKNLQNMITFKITPYIRDNHYSNHAIEPI